MLGAGAIAPVAKGLFCPHIVSVRASSLFLACFPRAFPVGLLNFVVADGETIITTTISSTAAALGPAIVHRIAASRRVMSSQGRLSLAVPGWPHRAANLQESHRATGPLTPCSGVAVPTGFSYCGSRRRSSGIITNAIRFTGTHQDEAAPPLDPKA